VRSPARFVVVSLLCAIAALGSIARAQITRPACPAVDGTWFDEIGNVVLTTDHDAIDLVYDVWGLPGPLRVSRVGDACVYVGHFENTRERLVEPTGRMCRVTYEGTATLTVRDASTVVIEATGESRCAWLPHDDPTRFRLVRTLSRRR
jgi:hypothetical protein